MTFEEYRKKAWTTALVGCKNSSYMSLGLANEAGEVCGKVKKRLRGDYVWNEDSLGLVKKELGDTLWYLAGLASVLDLNLDEIAEENIDKLQDRKKRGKIQGNGDTR